MQSVVTLQNNLDEGRNCDALAALCRAGSDTLRLEILRALRRDSFGVQELAFIFSVPQPGMSHHLKVLSSSGLLETRRQGNSIFYRRPTIPPLTPLSALKKSLFEASDTLTLEKSVLQRIEKVYLERSRQSQSFFEKHAKEFIDRQRSLCELSQYLQNMCELLDLANLPKTSKVMEVGPGQGLFLKELASRFDSVVALDNSDEMLQMAQRELCSLGSKVEFIHSSLEGYGFERCFDAIVLNMVLHHSASPDVFFKEIGTRLVENGYLLLADLCAHSQSWTKESCGDLWMGFEPEELVVWASGADLEERHAMYLGLKNGFQIQLKLFQKVSTSR